jgi:CPW-WPC domain-containing protein
VLGERILRASARCLWLLAVWRPNVAGGGREEVLCAEERSHFARWSCVLSAALCVFAAVPALARFDMIFGVAIFSCGALSGLASALPVAPVQASEPDTINIDFDVPAASLQETTSSLERRFAVHGRPVIAASSSASFLAAGAAASPEVNVHVPVPSVSSRKASTWLHDARAQVAVLKDLLRRQDAADERVKVAAATTGVALLEVHSRVSLPGSDLAKAVLGVAESSASGGAVLGALVPQNPLSGKVSDAAAAIQSGRAQADLFACEADFAASCPDGWSQSGAACVAPAVYAGPCERRREFASGDVAAKASFADSCDAPWPCKGGSDACPQGHDFGGCPKGWSQGRFGFCETSGEGPCGSAFHFADMPVSEKLDLAKACGFGWPCL